MISEDPPESGEPPLLEDVSEKVDTLAPGSAVPDGALAIHCGTCKADITGNCYIALVPGPQGHQALIFQPGRCPHCQAYTVHQVPPQQIARPVKTILRPS